MGHMKRTMSVSRIQEMLLIVAMYILSVNHLFSFFSDDSIVMSYVSLLVDFIVIGADSYAKGERKITKVSIAATAVVLLADGANRYKLDKTVIPLISISIEKTVCLSISALSFLIAFFYILKIGRETK